MIEKQCKVCGRKMRFQLPEGRDTVKIRCPKCSTPYNLNVAKILAKQSARQASSGLQTGKAKASKRAISAVAELARIDAEWLQHVELEPQGGTPEEPRKPERKPPSFARLQRLPEAVRLGMVFGVGVLCLGLLFGVGKVFEQLPREHAPNLLAQDSDADEAAGGKSAAPGADSTSSGKSVVDRPLVAKSLPKIKEVAGKLDEPVTRLARPGSQFAFDPVRGTLGVLEPEALVFYDVRDMSERGRVSVPATPLAVHYREWNDQGLFVVGGLVTADIFVVDGGACEQVARIEAPGAGIIDFASSTADDDSFVYFTYGEDSGSLGRLSFVTYMATQVGQDRISATDVELSPDGRLLYLRDQKDLSRGFVCVNTPGKSVEAAKQRLVVVHQQRRESGPWIRGPLGFFVTEGSRVLNSSLTSSRGVLEFPPSAFLGNRPFVVGYNKESSLVVASMVRNQTVGTYQTPEEWLSALPEDPVEIFEGRPTTWTQSRHRTSPIFFDQTRRQLILCDADKVMRVPVAKLQLPDDPTLTFSLELPDRVGVGQKIVRSVQTFDENTRVVVEKGPRGMEITDGKLTWVVSDKDLGPVEIRLIGTQGGPRMTRVARVVVERAGIEMPFSPRLVEFSPNGRLAVLMGRTKGTNGLGFDQVGVFDVHDRKLVASRELASPGVSAAINDLGQVFALTYGSRSDVGSVRKLSENTLEQIGTSAGFKLPGSRHRGVTLPNGLVSFGAALLRQEDLGVVATSEDPLSLGRNTFSGYAAAYASLMGERLPGGYLSNGAIYDDDQRLKLLKFPGPVLADVASVVAGCRLEQNPYFWGRSIPTVYPTRSSRRADSHPASFRMRSTPTRHIVASTTVPVVAAYQVRDNGKKLYQSRLTFFDLATGEKADEVVVQADGRPSAMHNVAIALSAKSAAVCCEDSLHIVSLDGLDLAECRAPFHFKQSVSTNVLSTEKDTLVKYQLASGRAPYKLECRAPRGAQEKLFSVVGTSLAFDARTVRDFAASRLVRRFQKSAQRSQYATLAKRRYEQLFRDPAPDYPVALRILVKATDADGKAAVMNHVLFVRLSKNDVSEHEKQ